MKKEKYYGDKIIIGTQKLDDKTYFGKERIKLLLKGGDIELPKEMADIAITKEPKDATALMWLRIRPTIEKILAVITEAELTVFEIQNHVLQNVASSATQNMQKANEVLWGKEGDSKTLLDVDKILNPKKYENTKGENKTKKG